MRAFRLIVLSSFLLSVWLLQAQTPFQFRFTLVPGPYPVGMRVAEQYDSSRTFQDESRHMGPRPLQILVWYPAERVAGANLTLGEYAALAKTETSFDHPIEHGRSQDYTAQFVQGIQNLPMRAVRNVPAAAGRFPLVIYAPSHNATNTENIELCEYLASYGFVVLAAPSIGASSRYMTMDSAEYDAQARDISFLISYGYTLPDVTEAEVAVMGFSSGGTAALNATARDKRVDALVGLDPSFLYGPLASDVRPEQLSIPLLLFSRGQEPLAYRDKEKKNVPDTSASPSPGPVFMPNAWLSGDLLHLEMLATSHISFSSMFQRSERFRNEGLQFTPADYTLDEGALSYNLIAQYTLEFLQAYLKHDADARTHLLQSPGERHIPKHLVAAAFRAGKAETAAQN